MLFCSLSDVTFHHRYSRSHRDGSSRSAIFGSVSVGLLASSLMLGSAARASVLVPPAILREDAASPVVEEPVQTVDRQDIVGVVSETLGFSTLVTAVEAANIGSVLSMEGPLTVFAPTDAAFALLPESSLEALLLPDNRDLLVKLLYNHVGYGDFTSDKLSVGMIDTFDSDVSIAFTPTGVLVDSATVIQADIDASNGVIHAVDQVLLPAGFSRALQARIAGEESTTAVVDSSGATVSTPATTERVSAPTEEPSTAAVEENPVRALW